MAKKKRSSVRSGSASVRAASKNRYRGGSRYNPKSWR